MAQCFVTTYRNHYRWQDIKKVASIKPDESFTIVIPSEDIWTGQEAADDELDPEFVEELIHKAYLKRYLTTYQQCYCKKDLPSLLSKPESTAVKESDGHFVENQLMKYCKNLYEPELCPKVAAPLPSTRRIFGYIRPKRNYTPLTNYQFWIGKTGYNILKGDYKKPSKTPQKPSIEEVHHVPRHMTTDKDIKGKKEHTLCECCCYCYCPRNINN